MIKRERCPGQRPGTCQFMGRRAEKEPARETEGLASEGRGSEEVHTVSLKLRGYSGRGGGCGQLC